MNQINVMLFKRYREVSKQPLENLGAAFGSSVILLEMYLLYSIPPARAPLSLELLLIPIILTSQCQKVLGLIMTEKSTLLIENMRMMGLDISAYWMGYFIWLVMLY